MLCTLRSSAVNNKLVVVIANTLNLDGTPGPSTFDGVRCACCRCCCASAQFSACRHSLSALHVQHALQIEGRIVLWWGF